jgi:hypothetical protein
MAFIEVKNFKPKNDGNQTALDEALQKQLEAEGFRQITAFISNHIQ